MASAVMTRLGATFGVPRSQEFHPPRWAVGAKSVEGIERSARTGKADSRQSANASSNVITIFRPSSLSAWFARSFSRTTGYVSVMNSICLRNARGLTVYGSTAAPTEWYITIVRCAMDLQPPRLAEDTPL